MLYARCRQNYLIKYKSNDNWNCNELEKFIWWNKIK